MNLSGFFGVVSTVDFALLGLWWVAVQARPDLRKRGSAAARMSYLVSLQFIVPGAASLLAQVDPTVTAVWRVSFAIAAVTGIVAIVFLVPTLHATGALTVERFLRFGALPMYALVTLIALIAPGTSKLSALQVEAILFCLVIALSVQVAWAAAMSEGSADPTAQPATRETRPAVPVTEPTASVTETTPLLPVRPSDKPAHGYQPPPGTQPLGSQPPGGWRFGAGQPQDQQATPPGGQHNPRR
jgi:hypothetical protein